MDRKKYSGSLRDVQDIIGVRVVCLAPAEVGRVLETMKAAFEVVEVVDKRPTMESVEFGYNSVHLVCRLPNPYVPHTYRPYLDEGKEMMFEIQLRTILQDAWAQLSHRISYKNPLSAPPDIARQMALISAHLEAGDRSFQDIFDANEKHFNKSGASRRADTRPITPDTLRFVIKRCYPWAAGWETGVEELKLIVLLLVEQVVGSGFRTVKDLTELLNRWRRKVAAGCALRAGERFHGPDSRNYDKNLSLYDFSSWQSTKKWHQRVRYRLNPIGFVMESLYFEAKRYREAAEELKGSSDQKQNTVS
jgi:ppGpp synthetase/RelA/SpoT-type nucleotidyltranferase